MLPQPTVGSGRGGVASPPPATRAVVVGTGAVLPGPPVTNAALAERLAAGGVETSDEWITARTGIRQRFFTNGETTTDLASQAARLALDDAGMDAADVDLIVVATSTPDWIFPSTACLVQSRLGVGGGAAFDVQAACCGFVYALATADALIRSSTARTALVIGAETYSRILDFGDRSTCVLFGDGAGALVLSASRSESGVLASRLHADGSHHHILRVAGGVAAGKVTGYPFLTMEGKSVFRLAVNALESVAHEALTAAGLCVDDVDWLIPHQANARIVDATAKRLGLPIDRVVVTVDRHANTSAASIPLALDAARKDGRIRSGQLLLLQGVGGGFTWGANVLRMA